MRTADARYGCSGDSRGADCARNKIRRTEANSTSSFEAAGEIFGLGLVDFCVRWFEGLREPRRRFFFPATADVEGKSSSSLLVFTITSRYSSEPSDTS